MRRGLRFTVVAVAAAAFAIPSASGAPASTTFAIKGFEYAFTPTVGHFAGVGTGAADEKAGWNARVVHDRLGSPPTYVDGGSFRMATTSRTGAADVVTGTFVRHGGTITTISPGTNCTKQRYRITGTLANVATRTTSRGSGSIDVTLTHSRARILGRCIAYRATVAGTVSVSY